MRGLRCPTCRRAFASRHARATHERAHTNPPALERIFARVDMTPGCWLFTGHRDGKGYGRVVAEGKARRAHRVVLAMALGRPLRPGMQACHHCDNPPCVRPSHLFEGTRLENVADMVAKGRHAAGEGNGRARLREQDVVEVRARLRAGESWAAVAQAFGVGKGTVQAIASGRTWQQVA